MSKLLSANFRRLRKNKCFLGGMFLMAVYAVYFVVVSYAETKEGYATNLDSGLFACTFFVSIILSVFCSLFVGTEYSDGTIRNKIIVGHKRRDIYLANLLTGMAAGVLICMAYFVVYLCVGIPLLGIFEANILLVMLYLIVALVLMFAYSAIFTLIAMLYANRAVVAVTCLLVAFLLWIAGNSIYSKLLEPEMIQPYTITVDGEMAEMGEEIKNPNYLEGTQRVVYEFLYDFLPGGQVMQCTSMETENPFILIVYSAMIFVLTTSGGLILFKRKDIK